MKIITISRQFGSGGRELGKRLADILGVPCYDKEIINEVAKMNNMNPESLEKITVSDILKVYPMTIGRTLIPNSYYSDRAVNILTAEQNVIKKLALQGDCVVVGRGADVILKDENPLNIFVYASKEARLARCLENIREGETEKDILKEMSRIDKDRAKCYDIISDKTWGDPQSYDLCINTSEKEIKEIALAVAEYAKMWFGE